jgi:hypothetical protein
VVGTARKSAPLPTLRRNSTSRASHPFLQDGGEPDRRHPRFLGPADAAADDLYRREKRQRSVPIAYSEVARATVDEDGHYCFAILL